jgi:autotransporter translocation and assembly factor TamB
VKSSPIDVALFQPATTALTGLSGKMETDLHIDGTLEAPRLNGQLNLDNAGFTVQSSLVTYSNALARLSFEGDRVNVDRFEVSDEDRDKLVAIGNFGIVKRSVGAMNVQLSAAQFKVLDNTFRACGAGRGSPRDRGRDETADLRDAVDAERPSGS